MSIAAAHDRLHLASAADPELGDAVTFAFGDPVQKLYGLARLGHDSDGTHGLAVLYAGERAVATSAGTGKAPGDDATWEDVSAAGVTTSVLRPLEAWTVAYAGSDGAFELRFEACSAPAEVAADSSLAQTAGVRGYEQLCRVSGSVSHGGRTYQVRCLGQRGQQWGAPRGKIAVERIVSAWLDEDRALTLATVRPAKSRGHLDEAVGGFVFEDGEPVAIDDPRLSTTYDAELRQRRAGLELWMDEEADLARRMAGEVICATTLELGEQRLHSAFFRWRMEGREGVGRYDVLRREDPGRRSR